MTLFDPAEAGGSADPGVDPTGGDGPEGDTGPEVVRVRMVVAYRGGGFHGFWPNEGVRTVGGTLIGALERVLGHPIEMSCAGRTDTGVHAHGQVVSFDAPAAGLDLGRLRQSVNRLCGPEVVVREVDEARPDFDARHDAVSRSYRYTIVNREVPDPFLATTAWHVTAPLDLRAMRQARDPLIGEHDFSSFCRRPRGEPTVSLHRRVLDARWHDLGDGVLRFDIEANAFCHQMVRSIVGTLADMGRGRLRAGDMTAIIRARDRQAAGQPAPPHGLMLWAVEYGGPTGVR